MATLYRWRRLSPGYFPAYPMSEEIAAEVAERLACEIEKVPDSGYEPYNIMRTPDVGTDR